MGFLLNQEQTMLRESALAFIAEQSPVAQQRALRDGAAPLGYNPALWQQAVELGWPIAALPENAGGLAVGYAGLGAIFELMGRHLPPCRCCRTACWRQSCCCRRPMPRSRHTGGRCWPRATSAWRWHSMNRSTTGPGR